MKKPNDKNSLLLKGIGLGILYGFLSRFMWGHRVTLASATYLFLIPTILGMIPLMFADNEKLKSYRNIIFIPWLTFLSFFLFLFLTGIEDIICLLILAAPFFVLGTIGALIYRLVQINKNKNKGKLLAIVLLPFLLGPVEEYFQSPSVINHIKSDVVISATPETVWNNIVEVKKISAQEYNAGFFNDMGIPKPVSANVDHKKNGGKRIGNFEGGLQFIETITDYRENKIVSFNILVNPVSVRQKVFDQHVLKGNYFSFVNATYQLSETHNGKIRLTLTSSYQLKTKVNWYGQLWGDMILKDFQDRLLFVIKNRCEKQ